jgi:hypothetical protein
MNAELDSLEKDIQMKEGLVQNLFRNQEQFDVIKQQFDSKLRLMEQEVRRLREEKDKMLRDMEQQVETTSEQKVHIRKLYEEKVSKLTEQLAMVKAQQREQERMLKLKQKSEEKIMGLQSDIIKMKKQKVDLIKKMKEEAKNYSEWKKARDKELVRLKAQASKQERTISALQTKTQQQDLVLHRRLEELQVQHSYTMHTDLFQATQRKIKEQQPAANINASFNKEEPTTPRTSISRGRTSSLSSSTDTSTTLTRPRSSSLTGAPKRVPINPPAPSQPISSNLPPAPKKSAFLSTDLLNMLKTELSKTLYRLEARETLEKEIKKRNALVEEIDQITAKINNSDYVRDHEDEIAQLPSLVETLEVNIQYQSEKISRAQKELLIADENADSLFNKLDQFTIPDTKTLVKLAFDMLLNLKIDESKANNRISTLETKVSDLMRMLDESRNANMEYSRRFLSLQENKKSYDETQDDGMNLLSELDQMDEMFETALESSPTLPSIREHPSRSSVDMGTLSLNLTSLEDRSKLSPTLPSSDRSTLQITTPRGTRTSGDYTDVFSRLTVKAPSNVYTGIAKKQTTSSSTDTTNALLQCQHTFSGHDGFVSSIVVNDMSLYSASHDMV